MQAMQDCIETASAENSQASIPLAEQGNKKYDHSVDAPMQHEPNTSHGSHGPGMLNGGKQTGAIPKVAYASLFKSNPLIREDSKLEYMETGNDMLEFSYDEMDTVEEAFGICRLGFVVSGRPLKAALSDLVRRWGKDIQYNMHNNGWIVFMFPNLDTKARVLSGENYMVYGFHLFLKEMPRCFSFQDEDLKTLPRWVQVHGLSLVCEIVVGLPKGKVDVKFVFEDNLERCEGCQNVGHKKHDCFRMKNTDIPETNKHGAQRRGKSAIRRNMKRKLGSRSRSTGNEPHSVSFQDPWDTTYLDMQQPREADSGNSAEPSPTSTHTLVYEGDGTGTKGINTASQMNSNKQAANTGMTTRSKHMAGESASKGNQPSSIKTEGTNKEQNLPPKKDKGKSTVITDAATCNNKRSILPIQTKLPKDEMDKKAKKKGKKKSGKNGEQQCNIITELQDFLDELEDNSAGEQEHCPILETEDDGRFNENKEIGSEGNQTSTS